MKNYLAQDINRTIIEKTYLRSLFLSFFVWDQSNHSNEAMPLRVLYLISQHSRGFQIWLMGNTDHSWSCVSFSDCSSVPFIWSFSSASHYFLTLMLWKYLAEDSKGTLFRFPDLSLHAVLSCYFFLVLELLTSFPSRSPSSSFSTQEDHHAPFAFLFLRYGWETPPGSKLGQFRVTLLAFPEIPIWYCQFSYIWRIQFYIFCQIFSVV